MLEVSKTDLASISENSYIGVSALPIGEGKVKAKGVMVFPEAARGSNEGYFPWDEAEGTTMTNATVAKLVKHGADSDIEVRFAGKMQTVLIDPSTSFGKFVPGTRELIKVGSKVTVVGKQSAGGPATARAVMVGKDGFTPPN